MGLISAILYHGNTTFREEAVKSPLHILPVPVLVILALSCLVMAACVAGLTLGLMSLDSTGLGIVMRSTDPVQAAAAKAIKPVREQGNLLLVTLLFANTLATELLPLVLEAIVPGGMFALIVSVVSIMLFGEIIPQAICSRHPLLIGYYMIGFVKVLRTILYPISAPIAYLLDFFLGEELATVYNREELKGLIDVHRNNAVLTQDETTILKGALEFSQKTVDQIMTPAENVFKLDIDSILDRETLLQILRSGHSRIPLYSGHSHNIVCLLLVKQLILVNPDDNIPIRSLISRQKRPHKIRVAPALECTHSVLIADLLNEFQTGRSHMAVVYDDVSLPVEERVFLGIVSIEDIIEEILQEEIIDETDNFTDNTNTTKVLVRNTEGKLIRTIASTTHTVVLPKPSTSGLVKEIDIAGLSSDSIRNAGHESTQSEQEKNSPLRWLLASPKEDSLKEPLLGGRAHDIEIGSPYLDCTVPNFSRPTLPVASSSSYAFPSPEQKPLSTAVLTPSVLLQYANVPGQSSLSLLNEDDLTIPEDLATPSIRKGITTHRLESTVTNADDDVPKTSKTKLKVRPLPLDASSERIVQIPPRNRSSHRVATIADESGSGCYYAFRTYGTLSEPPDIGESSDEPLSHNGLGLGYGEAHFSVPRVHHFAE